MKKLKLYMLAGFVFTVLLGSLAHFFYDWSHENVIIGLFAAINETTWEHMKLLFFPGLLWSYICYWKLKSEFPQILCNLFIGILIGTWTIPILYYLYTGLLGYHLLPVDIGIFVISTAISFCVSYRQAVSLDRYKYYCQVAYLCTIIMVFSFWINTIIQLG